MCINMLQDYFKFKRDCGEFIYIPILLFLVLLIGSSNATKRLTSYVIPFFGTATLWNSIDLGYTPTHRA